MKFIAATNNTHKLNELRRILERMGHTVQSQREAGCTLDPDENGDTFEENARIKATAVCAACGVAVIADDSGLCVDALSGAPGVYSARYAGQHGDDEANNDKLLAALQNVPVQERTARFVSCVCVCLPDGRCRVWRGESEGHIGFVRQGDNGFGYDPLFIPDAVGVDEHVTRANTQQRSYAQFTDAEKDAVSHRGAALRRMELELPAFLAG